MAAVETLTFDLAGETALMAGETNMVDLAGETNKVDLEGETIWLVWRAETNMVNLAGQTNMVDLAVETNKVDLAGEKVLTRLGRRENHGCR